MARARETSKPPATDATTLEIPSPSAIAAEAGAGAGEIGQHPPRTIDAADPWVDFMLAAGLVLLIVLLFGRAVGFDFVNLDDTIYITGNRHVTDGPTPGNLRWAFTALYHANWHPLTWWSWQIDTGVWGKEPWGYHLTNLVLHAINALLVWRVVWLLTGRRIEAFVIALVFAIHPLRWESVAWISERKGLLSALFALLAVERYDAYYRSPGWKRMGVVAACLTLSLMSKAMAVSFPCVLLLLDWRPYRRWTSLRETARLVLEKWPLWIIVAISCVLTVAAQKEGGAVRNLEEVSLTQRVVGAAWAYAVYIGQTLWPSDLCVFYPIPASRPVWQPAIALTIIGVMTLLAFVMRRRWPAVAVGWLCYLGMLIPVIGLVQVGEQSHADRYTYLPGIPLLVAIGTCVVAAAGQRWSNRVQVGLVVAIAVPLLIVSSLQGGTWRNRRTLWLQATRAAPCNVNWWHFGQIELVERRYDEAIRAFQESSRLDPASAEDRASLAAALDGAGRLAEAEASAREAVAMAGPDKPELRAGCRFILGKGAIQRGAVEEAMGHFDAGLKDAKDVVLRNDLAVQLLRLGPEGAKRAIPALLSLVEELPQSPEFPGNLANAYTELGDWASAAAEFSRGVRLDPGDPRLRSRWITALVASGQKDVARIELRTLLGQDPNWPTGALRGANQMTLNPKASRSKLEEGYWLAETVGLAFETPPAEALQVMAQGAAGLGRFDEAEQLAKSAILAALRNGQSELAAAIQKQQERYRAKERPSP